MSSSHSVDLAKGFARRPSFPHRWLCLAASQRKGTLIRAKPEVEEVGRRNDNRSFEEAGRAPADGPGSDRLRATEAAEENEAARAGRSRRR
jgi:hypothetical protein